MGVEDCRHADAQLANNPPAGMAPLYEKLRSQYEKYTYDPHTDPHRYVQPPDGQPNLPPLPHYIQCLRVVPVFSALM
jgi:hypothetical protein